MFPSENQIVREFDAVHLAVESSIDQGEAVLRLNQQAQTKALALLHAAVLAGNPDAIDDAVAAHGRLIAEELQLQDATGRIRDMMGNAVAQFARLDGAQGGPNHG